MASSLPDFPKPKRETYLARRAVQIALQIRNRWPDYVPGVEATRLLAPDGIKHGTFHDARRLVKHDNKELIDKVLAGEVSLYHAMEYLEKGARVKCPTCEGRGHIYRMEKQQANST